MSVEMTATVVALVGFLPFAFFTALLLADPQLIRQAADDGTVSIILTGLKLYAAIVLSFVVGIRWGVAIMQQEGGRAEKRTLVLAAVPTLVGAIAFFTPEPWSFAVLAVAFAATGWWDSRIAGNKGVPDWFGRMRLLMTVLVMATMIAAFAATFQPTASIFASIA